MTEREMEDILEDMKRETIMLVSFVKPDTILNISKIWDYQGDTLYNMKQKVIGHKLLIPLNDNDKVGEEKFLKTNMKVLLNQLSARSMISGVEDEIQKLYFEDKYLKEVLYVETLKALFEDRKTLYEYYYELMPVFLVFLPICIKLYQEEGTTNAILTMAILISMRFARVRGERSKSKYDIRHHLLFKGLYYLVEKFGNIDLPIKPVSRLYKYISRDEEFRAYPLEEEFMKHRLNKAKYRQFDI